MKDTLVTEVAFGFGEKLMRLIVLDRLVAELGPGIVGVKVGFGLLWLIWIELLDGSKNWLGADFVGAD